MCQALFQVLCVCYPILAVLSPDSPMRKMYNNLHFTEEFEVYNETEAERKVKLLAWPLRSCLLLQLRLFLCTSLHFVLW